VTCHLRADAPSRVFSVLAELVVNYVARLFPIAGYICNGEIYAKRVVDVLCLPLSQQDFMAVERSELACPSSAIRLLKHS
jgi:hypothetical protein